MQQLNVLDFAMISAEVPHAPYHLGMAGIYDPSTRPGGPPTFDDLVTKLESLLPEVGMLRRKLVRVPFDLDRPYWVDDDAFDLEFHVRHVALPRPGDWRQYRTLIARLNSRPLDMSRPPWEFTVIEGVDAVDGCPPGCFATFLKIHHCMIDGASGVELHNKIHDRTVDAAVGPVERQWIPEPHPSDRALLGKAARNAVVNPGRAFRAVLGNLTSLGREVVEQRRRQGSRSHQVCRTRFNGRISPHRTWEEALCSLDDLKALKRMVSGATINDVCISIVASALHGYLVELGEPPGCPLVTSVPVSVRAAGETATGGNQVSMITVGMHDDIADHLQRIAAIHAETSVKKATQKGVTVPVLQQVAEAVPGALIGGLIRAMTPMMGRGPAQFNTVVTNVPGPTEALYLIGCRHVRGSGAPPIQDGIGLFHNIASAPGGLIFGFNADRAQMPDPEQYQAHLERSIAEHVALVGSGSDVGRRRAPRS